MTSKELDRIKTDLLEVSRNILKLYDKLENLSLQGKCDTLEYNEIKSLLSCLKRVEEEKYSEIYKNSTFFKDVSNKWINEIQTLLDEPSDFSLFYSERNLLPYLRIYNKFISYIWKSQYFDQIYNLELPKDRLDGNTEFFRSLLLNSENRVLEKLLLKKLSSFSVTDKRYELLNKYYYTSIYTSPILDNNFVCPTVYENENTFGEFVESLPLTEYKQEYKRVILEDTYDELDNLIQQFIVGVIVEGGYTASDMVPLYFTLIEAKLSVLDQDSLVQIGFDMEQIISNMIPFDETSSVKLAKRTMLDYQTKEFVKKYQNKNT